MNESYSLEVTTEVLAAACARAVRAAEDDEREAAEAAQQAEELLDHARVMRGRVTAITSAIQKLRESE